jgi:hypothetical protein
MGRLAIERRRPISSLSIEAGRDVEELEDLAL